MTVMGAVSGQGALTTISTVVTVAMVVLLASAGAVGPGAAAGAPNNTTTAATETATATAAETATTQSSTDCEPQSDAPQLSQSRLYAPEKTITSDEPGQIAGGFQVAADASCPVVVSITMSVPSGMRISGASDIMSSGAGLATAKFTVEPGEIQDIRANVYSENTGERTVTADITYWPEGQKDKSRSIDGISLTFDVEEPNTGTEVTSSDSETNASSEGGESESDGGGLLDGMTLLVFGGFAIVVLGIVAAARS